MSEITPREVRQQSETELAIVWNDDHKSVYPVRLLRLACRCAGCVDEASGEKMLRDDSVSQDVKPIQLEPTGRYAYTIHWNDGHSTGIYTYEYLRELCPCCQEISSS
jgi:DUF971 family protein